ncbi:MAG TPA: FAD-binding oxidoreductase [Kofleriaceae bacterium]|nr:FAD-binding oxidoreductase [Kofleriaceae bacterium]
MRRPDEAFFAAALRELPGDFLSRDPADLETYGRDWTRVHAPDPSAVAFPRTTDEVARFVRLCHQHDVAVVPSGGRTGLAGGAVAHRGEVVLSLARMNRMDPVDATAHAVRVQAGAVTEAVHRHCEPAGLFWPVDFASKGSSQVGGNIATNAGGVRVVRYGVTRQWVLGLEVVTMGGEVLRLNGALEKNNTGPDLRQLFIGSEGTLGIITEATLKLAPLPREPIVFFFAVESVAASLELFARCRMEPAFQLSAFELVTRRCLELVVRDTGKRDPLETVAPAYVLVEVEPRGAPEALDAWVEQLLESGAILDGTMSRSGRDARELWSLREGISECLARQGLLHKNDIDLPVSSLTAFIGEMDRELGRAYPDLQVYVFGHVGDGNLHVNIVKPDTMSDADFHRTCHAADEVLFGIVRAHAGSVSAEHGIGLLKKHALRYSRSPIELAIFRDLKRALDPKGLLNPGKIFD